MPSNFAPGPWVSPVGIKAADIDPNEYHPTTFDNRVNNFEYYNCNDSETGLYTSFYKFVN